MRRILALARRLRRDCPWDRSRTLKNFKKCVLDEVREIGQAIDRGDRANLAEEIGDSLWNLAFLVVLAEEKKWFDYDRVVHGLLDKMVRRHPHVFGDEKAGTPAEALATFNRVKKREKVSRRSPPTGSRRRARRAGGSRSAAAPPERSRRTARRRSSRASTAAASPR